MKIAVLQSNYIPWKGYFDIIRAVDLVVFHDDIQYTSRIWRDRNQVVTAHGSLWLTLPVLVHLRETAIQEVQVAPTDWACGRWMSPTHRDAGGEHDAQSEA